MEMMVSDQELDALLKRLHLANTRRAWRELARRAEQEDWTYHDFLALLVTEEIAHRQQTRLERVVRRARFPFLKTIDDFTFLYQSTVRLSLLGSALSADFTTEGHCLIFNGKPGRGKTHLAIALDQRQLNLPAVLPHLGMLPKYGVVKSVRLLRFSSLCFLNQDVNTACGACARRALERRAKSLCETRSWRFA